MTRNERVYHTDLWLRLLIGFGTGLPGALMAVLALITGLTADGAAVPLGVFAAAFLWMAGDATTRYVRLSRESIEIGTLFRMRRLKLDQIVGKRIVRGRSVAIFLYPASPGGARLAIGGGFSFDTAFWAWLDSVPSLPD